jgi:SAM-dependent methyltransferase
MRRIKKSYRHRQRKGLPPKVRRLRGGLDLLLEALAAYGPIDAPPRGARALDFGCGDGKFLDRLQDRGWDTYGIEPSTNVAFLRHHRLKVPPADASFDLVVLHHVLEHVTAPLDLLQQLAGTLRDGGMLCVSVPRLDTLPEHRELQYCLDGNRHPVCFSERCLAGLLARAGCAVTAVLDQPELDTAQTEGRRVRLRIVATRTSQPLSLPAAPLAPALAALGKYRSAAEEGGSRFLHCLPVRMRGALLDRVRNPSQGKHE